MAKDAIVSDETARKFAKEKETPYTRWVKAEGLEIMDGIYQEDLNTIELKPWASRNGRGVFLNHDASRTSNDCYVCEIAPGEKLNPLRQLYEEMILSLVATVPRKSGMMQDRKFLLNGRPEPYFQFLLILCINITMGQEVKR